MSFAQKYRDFSLVTLGNFFFFCNFSSFFLLPLFIKDIGGDEARIGYVMGTFGITSIGVIPFAAYLIDHYGRRRFMLAGSFLMFLVSFLYIFISDIDVKIFLLRLMQGIAFAFFFTSAATAVSDYVPSEIRAYGLGIFGAFTIASYSVGPTIGEIVIERFSYSTFFLYTSLFSLLPLFCVFFRGRGTSGYPRNPFSADFSTLFSPRGSVCFCWSIL